MSYGKAGGRGRLLPCEPRGGSGAQMCLRGYAAGLVIVLLDIVRQGLGERRGWGICFGRRTLEDDESKAWVSRLKASCWAVASFSGCSEVMAAALLGVKGALCRRRRVPDLHALDVLEARRGRDGRSPVSGHGAWPKGGGLTAGELIS